MANKNDLFQKVLEDKAKTVNEDWVNAGKERQLSDTEKRRRRLLWAIAFGVLFTDIACLVIIYLITIT